MEAKIKNVRLNVGANFQARVIETDCSKTISRMTGLEVGDRVQIYPNTVNSHLPNPNPKTVAVRKISNYLVSGHFFVLPIDNLNLNEDQLSLIAKINVTVGKIDPHLTFIKHGACSEILERATGLSNGCRVKFYPYTVDVFLEQEDAIFTVLPLVTVAVRQYKNGQTVGNFVLMDVTDLNLSSVQQQELQDIILEGLSGFAEQESANHKEAKFLFKKLKKEFRFLSEEAILDLTQN